MKAEEEESEWQFPNYYFVRLSRFAGLLATMLFLHTVIVAHYHSPKQYAPSGRIKGCEVETFFHQKHIDSIDFESTLRLRFQSQYRSYQLVEYLMEGVSSFDNYPDLKEKKEEPARIEIPVFITPGRGDEVDTHYPFAKVVTDLAMNKNYRFRFYVVHFNMEAARWSAPHFRRMQLFTEYAFDYVQQLFPKQKTIRICRSFEGNVGFNGPMEHYAHIDIYRMHKRDPDNLPDLFIFESMPVDLPGYYEKAMENSMKQTMRRWNENQGNYSLGAVSFDGGYTDTAVDPSWLKGKSIDRIPVWTIDDVPDMGLTTGDMLKCKPFLHQVADLLISYAEKQSNETGKDVAKAYYEKWESKMQASLPIGWKKDLVSGIAYKSHSFVINGSMRTGIRFPPMREYNVWMSITGSCLTSATLIRQNKYIRRKEPEIDSRFDFGIFNVKKFEDMKLFLESNGVCDVHIQFPSDFAIAYQRFHYSVFTDPHYVWVGAQIVTVFLFVLENERQSTRLEHQFYLYTSFVAAVIYHTFGTFGLERSGEGILLGAGFALSVHYVCSIVDQSFFNLMLGRNLDSYLSPHYQRNFFRYLFLSVFAHVYSAAAGAAAAVLLFSISSRLFLAVPFIVTYLPIFYAVNEASYAWALDYRQLFIGCGMPILIFAVIGTYYSMGKKIQVLSRDYVYVVAVIFSVVQIFTPHLTLDYHYSIGFIILAFNHAANNYIPESIYSERIDPDKLESEYEALDTISEKKLKRRY